MSRKHILILMGMIGVASIIGATFSSYTNESNDPSVEKKEEAFQKVKMPPVPKTLTFAGENVPLDNFDIREALEREILINTYFHSQTIRLIKMAPRYFKMIEPILKQDSIPDDFKYLSVAESGFNPIAVSPSGAVGMWQFLKGTAKDYGLEVNTEIDERYHIEKSTHAACAYLHESFEMFGNWTTVAASYNVGRNGIQKQVERQKESHYYNLLLNEETTRYVFRIMALKLILESPEEYGFDIPKSELYPSIPNKVLEITGPVADFADFAHQHNINYKLLKYFNPWLREAYLTNEEGKTYEIIIPKGKYRHYD